MMIFGLWPLLSGIYAHARVSTASTRSAANVADKKHREWSRSSFASFVDDSRFTFSLNGTPIITEPPPENFGVEIAAKTHGLMFSRNDFYSSLLRGMAKTAQLDWNSEIRAYRLQPVRNIAMGFVSSRDPPRYQVKAILWTMVALFHTFNGEGRWTESSWKTVLEPQTIGVGNIFYRNEASTPSSSTNYSGAAQAIDGNVTGSSRTDSSSGGSVAMQQRQTAGDSGSGESSGPANPSGDLSLKLDYRPGGASFPAIQIWTSFVYALLTSAETDREEGGKVCTVYNTDGNFTFAIVPRERGSEDLKWHTVINCLWLIPDTMLSFQPGGKWAEMFGNIRSHGYNVGKFVLLMGQITPTNIESELDAFAWTES